MNLNLFYCQNCGKIIAIVKDSCTQTICCQHPMTQLHVNTSQNLIENSFTKFNKTVKHNVPIISVKGKMISVTLGSKLLIQSGILNDRLKNPAFSQITAPQDFSNELDFAVMSGERVEAEFSLF